MKVFINDIFNAVYSSHNGYLLHPAILDKISIKHEGDITYIHI